MNTKFLSILAAFAAVMIIPAACTDLSDIEDRVDTLESRVESLETICKALNENVSALQAFTEANKSISSVVEDKGKYTLTLSDGTTVVLSQGSEGQPVMPEIAINKDGFWTVNGVVLKVGENPVPATGANGATPIFGVDAEGYWTVKYAANETPARVLDVNGQPVKATPSGVTPGESNDSFFKDVKVEGDKVVITLKADGKSYSLPIVPDFICAIKGAEGQPVIFQAGETKTYTVEQKNVASATIFTPAGWEASLDEAILSITAPGMKTRASADTRQDVSILAISAGGFAAITKVKVQLDDAPIIVVPVAAAVAGEATQGSLTFTVNLSNASEWYYTLLKAGETAPDAEALKAATKGAETTLTLTKDASGADLTPSTEYVLYVLPVNATADGEVTSATGRTADKTYATLLEKYNDGGDIMVGDKVINKAVYGEATLLTKDAAALDGSLKVYFVEPDAEAVYNSADGRQTLIVIGNKAGTRSRIKFTSQLKLSGFKETDVLVISGMEVDASGAGNYLLVQNANAAYEYVHLNDCHIKPMAGKAFTYVSSNARSYRNFIMTGCEYPAAKNNWIISLSNSTATYENLKFENNIFYNSSSTTVVDDFRLFQGPKATIGSLTMNNNTFINLHTGSTSAYGTVQVETLGDMTAEKNLVFTTMEMAKSILFVRPTNYPADGSKIKDNVYYETTADEAMKFQICFGGKNKMPGSEDPTALTENPFDGGTFDLAGCKFVPAAAYAAYGAQR